MRTPQRVSVQRLGHPPTPAPKRKTNPDDAQINCNHLTQIPLSSATREQSRPSSAEAEIIEEEEVQAASADAGESAIPNVKENRLKLLREFRLQLEGAVHCPQPTSNPLHLHLDGFEYNRPSTPPGKPCSIQKKALSHPIPLRKWCWTRPLLL